MREFRHRDAMGINASAKLAAPVDLTRAEADEIKRATPRRMAEILAAARARATRAERDARDENRPTTIAPKTAESRMERECRLGRERSSRELATRWLRPPTPDPTPENQ